MAETSKGQKAAMLEEEQKASSGTSRNTSGPQNLTLNTHKAGMQGLDTERINEVIKRASEGSRFYQHKQKHQQQLNEKLEQMKKEATSFTEEQIRRATKQMDQLVRELEAERDLSHTIVHVDMDMFYAAVEMRDNPALRDKPMAVGSTGMLSTSNYAARKFGVRAAMPGFIGKKLCPELIIVPPNFDKYKAVSKVVREVFSEYDPGFSPMSLDEAYLDITEYLQKNSSLYIEEEDGDNHEKLAQAVVNEMRRKIEERTQLTASAGIAANTRLAKVCSDLNKPNGQYYLPPDKERVLEFVSTLSIRKVSGIGNVTEQQLQALDITQCSQLMEKRGLLRLLFSETNHYYFLSIALGLGHSTLSAWTEKDRKSISTETTFKGTSDRATLFKLTADLCHELADEMQQKDIVGKVLTLKLKTTDFQIRTRAQTLSEATRCAEVMAAGIKRLLQHEMNAAPTDQPLSLRLLGVRMSSLTTSSEAGQRRQATLTQMFSQSAQPKAATPQNNQEPRQSHKRATEGNIESQSENNVDINASVKEEKTNKEKGKVTSLEQFLSKSKAAKASTTRTEVYECSVCEELVNVESLEEFNKHLDTCLEIHTSPVPKSSHTDHDQSDNRSKPDIDHSDCEVISDVETQNDVCHLESQRNTQDPSTSSLKQVLLCPVCEKCHFSDMLSLNNHIDECLNKSAISELLQEGNSQHQEALTSRVSKADATKQQQQTSRKRKGNAESQAHKKTKGGFNTLDRYFRS
ncbi:DNA polymerase kappa-like [Eriocheir sinensis]|uniref:DNA polymerase kappa-like n=1 Tax=Eriocheir sinensis TaxID=95602 RepID=UPI0021C922F1|nr:DNA polymerase kappa-like [Eriocheir sinensis]